MADGEPRYPPQAVDAPAVVDVLGPMRPGGQLGQRGPRAVRRQIAAFLDGHHVGREHACVLRRSRIGIRVLNTASVAYPCRHAPEGGTSTVVEVKAAT